MKKIVFLDIDGTLCNEEGLVPDSAQIAVKKARENGHEVYLCTGRSKAEIYDFIMDIGFDGIIGAGGGFVTVGDEMLYHKRVSDSDVKHLVDYFDDNNVDYYLESNGGLYASKNLVAHLERLIYGDLENDPNARTKKETQPNHFIEAMIEGEIMYRSDVNKACFLQSDIGFEAIKAEFDGKFNVIHCTVPSFGPDSGELAVPGVHKGTAIEELLAHIGATKEQTLALGDGLNDIEMLEFCHVGIAMGNAKEGLKNIADEITLTHDEGGIFESFKKHGLI